MTVADWILIPSLVRLRAEFNAVAPWRDRASDGSIGDALHAGAGTSDHLPDEDFPALRGKDADRVNEVHAIDVDDDLRTPGLSMEAVVQFLLARCRSGAENRLRYIIYNRRMWRAANDWQQEAYAGDNPHTEHAHFSGSYVSAREADVSPWHLEDLIMAVQDDVWNYDIDAGAGSLSAKGGLKQASDRTGYLANTFAPGVNASLAAIAADADAAKDNAAAAALSAGSAAAAVAFLTDDFPNDGDPEADPIVIRLRYVLANPPA